MLESRWTTRGIPSLKAKSVARVQKYQQKDKWCGVVRHVGLWTTNFFRTRATDFTEKEGLLVV